MTYIQDPALWGLIVGTPLAATALVQARKNSARLRKENENLRSHYSQLENNYAESVEEAKQRAEEGTRTALKAAMRTLQGLANEQQLAVSRLQKKYGEHHILQDLLEIDHMNSQFGRRAQSIAVLCDGWLGRQRAVASVYDVVRSAKGRIRHFKRVEIRSQTNFAITSRAVEPVALALAELLDNATSYSAPETPIDINIRTVPKGVCIVIDDAGVGMNEEEKTRATRLLTAQRSRGVSELGNPPQFGFAVIGVLAAQYGFSVSVDSSSPYGGVRAVVLIPDELLTSMTESPEPAAPQMQSPQAAPMPAAMPAPNAPQENAFQHGGFQGQGYEAQGRPPGGYPAAAPAQPPAAQVQQANAQPVNPFQDGMTSSGTLPKRRRRGQMSVVPQPGTEAAAGAPARSDEETASIMGAFQRGTQSGRNAFPSSEGHGVQ
jgi:two-component sensor histidine kinase